MAHSLSIYKKINYKRVSLSRIHDIMTIIHKRDTCEPINCTHKENKRATYMSDPQK